MTPDFEDVMRLLAHAIQTHRDQHRVYGSTATCSGGIGGQAMTQHCSVACHFSDHEAVNAKWDDVERAYFRLADGNPEWVYYVPGGRLSSCPV